MGDGTAGMEGTNKYLALALSGGGFRALLFHLGSLWRLNELGYLKRLNRVSSVSGGSIIAGWLGLKWKELQFVQEVAQNFSSVIVSPMWDFCSKGIDVSSGIWGFLNPFKTAGQLLTEKYAERLFGQSTLQDIPGDNEGPRFVIYATNLHTGVSFRFSRPYISDYLIGKIENPTTPLALAVAASSAFPPFFTPVRFACKPEDWTNWPEGTRFFNDNYLKRDVLLSDGGVYDNMGLETVWRDFKNVLVSDAGAPFGVKRGKFFLNHSMLIKTKRVLDINVEQARALRRRMLVNGYELKSYGGAYWGISTKIKGFKLAQPIINDNELTESMAQVRTRLSAFTDIEKGHLINWGYAITDTAMRKYVATNEPPGKFPFPEYALDK